MSPLKRRAALFSIPAAVLLLGLGIPAPGAQSDAPAEDELVLLFTSDLHSAVLPHGVVTDAGRVEVRGGFARIASMIKAEREKEGGRVLAVDAGDFTAGSLFQTLFQSEAAELRLMRASGFEVGTIGNHEYDYGPAALARALTTAKVNNAALPLVASNTFFDRDDERDDLLEAVFADYPVREYLVLEKNGLKVGLFGLLGEKAADDAPDAVPVTFSKRIVRAREMTARLRDTEKVDLVIALSHSGVYPDPKKSEDEILAREVPGIDVIVSGHPHVPIRLPIQVGSTLIVGVGDRGEDLGYLRLVRTIDGRFQATAYALRPVTEDIPEDPAVAAEVAVFQEMVEAMVSETFGLDPGVAVAETGFALVDERRATTGESWEIGLGDLVVDSYRAAAARADGGMLREPTIAIHPWGQIRDALLPGPITGNDVFSVLSLGVGPDGKAGYPLVSVRLTGREIRRLFEVETSVAPGNEDAHLQLAGAVVRYNPRRILFDRVTSIEIAEADGTMKPAEPDRLYRVVANLYMARMIGYVSKASHGILNLEPKDADGNPRTDFENLIIDGDPSSPGVQEIKEWAALAAFLKTFPDTDGNGIPEFPGSYASSAGRLVDEPSWNPFKLLSGIHGPTIAVLVLGLLVLLLLWLIVRKIRRRLARPISGGR
ncbi:MAG: bifunctional metallophosphatase/5'-nucleotidase [Candidatus Aminicenantes bacterium]|nr:bifunctional metallophosphatase/5'-nucleotidase [Candidatus Aminicenantes bacterium]